MKNRNLLIMAFVCTAMSACKEQHNAECTPIKKQIYKITRNVEITPPANARLYFDSTCKNLTTVILDYGWNGSNFENNDHSPVSIISETTPIAPSPTPSPESTQRVKHNFLPIDLIFNEDQSGIRSMQTISRMEVRGKFNKITGKPYTVICDFGDKNSKSAEEWQLASYGSSRCSGSILIEKGGHVFQSSIYVDRESVPDLQAIYTKAEELLDSMYQEVAPTTDSQQVR